MQKLIYTTILLCLFSNILSAQCPWLRVAGTDDLEDSWDLTTDDQDDIFVAGKFINQTLIGGQTMTNPYGASSIYVQHLSPLGAYLNIIQIDTDGNLFLNPGIDFMDDHLYLTASVFGSVFVNGNTYTSNGYDVFIFKIKSDFSTIDVLHLTGAGNDRAMDVLTDPANNELYISGDFFLDLDFGVTILNSTDFYDGYVLRLDANLNPISVQHFSGTNLERAWKMDIDAAQNLYVSGFFADQLTLGGQTFSNGMADFSPFVAKIDNAGSLQWLRAGTSTTISGFSSYYDVAIDASGAVYVTGFLAGIKDFSGTTLDPANGNCILLKYDSSGTLLWTKQEGSTTELLTNWGAAVELDDQGNIFWLGNITDDVSTFAGTALPTFILDSQHSFLATYDPSGAFQQVEVAGLQGSTVSYGLEVDSQNEMIVCGQFFEGANINFGSTTEPNPALGTNDDSGVFVYRACNLLTSVHEADLVKTLDVWPNPVANQLMLSIPEGGQELQVFDVVGRLIHTYPVAEGTSQVNLSALDAGWHVLILLDSQGRKLGVGKVLIVDL